MTEETSIEQQAIEEAAIEKHRETHTRIKEQATGSSDMVPEGYNADGTPVEETTSSNDEPILGKFKSQDDLVKAYQELEKKLGAKQDDTTTPDTTPKEEDEGKKEETTAPLKSFEKFTDEFRNEGKLSEGSYKELETLGFNSKEVDAYIEGQKALADKFTTSIYDSVGGTDNYTELITWASEGGLEPSVIGDYNEALSQGNVSKVTQLLEYMNLKRGNVPTKQKIVGTASNDVGGMKAFSDKGEWQTALRNPLYGKDSRYTNMIDKRYLASRTKGTI